jgi:cation diffusion facilitator CzcD-associated flavoprotein CzcO
VEKADVFVPALGRFNAWKLPDYPGIDTFQGHLRHTSNWDPNFDPKGKEIALIGNGASGIQILPQLQKVVKHVDHYARSPTWIGTSWVSQHIPKDTFYTEEQLKEFQDPVKYYQYRKKIENTLFNRFSGVFKDSEATKKSAKDYEQLMKTRLGHKAEEYLPFIKPDFSPGCRRLTPGPGYLEALIEDNVSFIPTRISHFTTTSIVTIDGIERKADAVLCATGADTSTAPQFPLIAHNRDLSQISRKGGNPGFPDSYLGVAVPGFPNLFLIHGPNASGPGATLCHSVEQQITYIARCVRKISRQAIRTMTPSAAAARDFREYCESFFPKTVLTDNCSSWINGGVPGGRISGVWPGSGSHVAYVRREPRWEDYEYTYKSKDGGVGGNRFAWFGNGWTRAEERVKLGDDGVDMTVYLKPSGTVDLATYHEAWNELPLG